MNIRPTWFVLLPMVALLSSISCDKKKIGKAIIEARSKVVLEERDQIKEDTWVQYSFKVNSDAAKVRVTGQHAGGPPLDFLLFDMSDFNAFVSALKSNSKDQRFVYKAELSSMNLSGQFATDWYQIPKGEYVYVIDNSAHFGAATSNWNFTEATALYAIKVELSGDD